MLRRTLLCLLTLALALPLCAADGAASAKKKKKRRPDPYEGSKYKSYKVLTPEEGHTYRFDEQGNPVGAAPKKTTKGKKKKASSDEGDKADKPDCAEDNCSEPKSGE